MGHDGIFISLQERYSGNNKLNVGLIAPKHSMSGKILCEWCRLPLLRKPEDC